MKHPETLAPVLRLLSGIGIDLRRGAVSEDSFLPGVAIRRGGLVYDASRLLSPGDLLHEAGHLAVLPSNMRTQVSGDIDASLAALQADQAGAAAIDHTDLAPIAWSYAAALAINMDPVFIFDAAGYGAGEGGDVAVIASQLAMGLFPGIMMLEKAGLCAAPPPLGDGRHPAPYPHMTRWLAA